AYATLRPMRSTGGPAPSERHFSSVRGLSFKNLAASWAVRTASRSPSSGDRSQVLSSPTTPLPPTPPPAPLRTRAQVYECPANQCTAPGLRKNAANEPRKARKNAMAGSAGLQLCPSGFARLRRKSGLASAVQIGPRDLAPVIFDRASAH